MNSRAGIPFFLNNMNKLYFRDQELSVLDNLFTKQHECSQIILIKGTAGSGKTALGLQVEHCQKTYYSEQDNQHGGAYFLRGNFRQIYQPQLYQAYVDAFRYFFLKLNDRDKSRLFRNGHPDNHIIKDIQEKQILGQFLPELLSYVHEIQFKSDLDQNVIRNHSLQPNSFKHIYGNLLNSLASNETVSSIILFFDDVHFAKEMDLDFLITLFTDVINPKIHFVITYNCEKESHSVKKYLPFFELLDERTTKLILKDINKAQITTFVADKLALSTNNNTPTLNAEKEIFQDGGNFFLLLKYVSDMLRKEEALQFTEREIQPVGANLLVHIQSQLLGLPKVELDLLRVASCLGCILDFEIMSYLLNDKMESCFENSIKMNLIYYDEILVCWTFASEKLVEIVYEDIAEQDRPKYHHRIGRELWRQMSLEKLEYFIFVVVLQLVKGKTMMECQAERTAVAKLCMLAGEKAVGRSAFRTAYSFVLSGIDSLDKDSSWIDEYELSLNLYSAAAECSFSSGHGDAVGDYASIIEANAITFDDTIRVQIINLSAIGSTGNNRAAKDFGFGLLGRLGEAMPSRTTYAAAYFGMRLILRRINKLGDDAIVDLPVMTDPRKLAIMQVLNITMLYAYVTSDVLGAILLYRLLGNSLSFGISSLSCTGLLYFGEILYSQGYPDEANRMVKLSVQIHEKFQNRNFYARVSSAFYFNVRFYKTPITECIEPLMHSYFTGMETGDIEYAMICGVQSLFLKFEYVPFATQCSGLKLLTLKGKMVMQNGTIMWLRPMLQFLLLMMSGTPLLQSGDIAEEHEIKEWRESNNGLYKFSFYIRTLLFYLLGDYTRVLQLTRACSKDKFFDNGINGVVYTMIKFMDGLCCVSLARKKRHPFSLQAQSSLKFLRRLADQQSDNFLTKYLLLQAEIISLYSSNNNRTLTKYKVAILTAKEGRSMLEYALANELTAKFLLRTGMEGEGVESYIRQAIETYTDWGATAKVHILQMEMKDYGFKHL